MRKNELCRPKTIPMYMAVLVLIVVPDAAGGEQGRHSVLQCIPSKTQVGKSL